MTNDCDPDRPDWEIEKALAEQRRKDKALGRVLFVIGYRLPIQSPNHPGPQVVAVYVYRN